jgi:hypothetical protein
VVLLRNADGRDLWAESRLAGSKIGFYHEDSTLSGSETLTSIENDLIFNRMGSKVEIKSSWQYQEDRNLHLVSIHSVMTSSAQPTTVDVTVGENILTIRTSTGGKTYDRTLNYAGELSGPEAGRRLHVSRLKSPGDAVSHQMFFPELGAVALVRGELAACERIAIEGTERLALKVRQTVSAIAGTSTVWLDEAGWLLRLTSPTPFGDMETTAISASAHGQSGR